MAASRSFFFMLVLVCAASTAVPAQSLTTEEPAQALGQVAFVDGYVDVHRDGEILDWRKVDIGLEIEDYDLVETGEDGRADIELTTPSSRGVTVHVAENSAFYFDVGTVRRKQQTRFEMLAGSLGLKVQRLSGDGEVVVKTPTMTLGVRGTEFDVTAAPEGSFLVTCVEGLVECVDESGTERRAQAGQVVEKTDSSFRSIRVPVSELERFRDAWAIEREEIFRAGAPTFVSFYARQFVSYLPQFQEAYNELRSHLSIFQEWGGARRSGVATSMGSLLLQRKEVGPAVIGMRGLLPLFESIYYRLKVLDRFHRQGIGTTQIDRRLSSTQFFSDFNEAVPVLNRRMAEVRYYFKLYARNTGFDDNSLIDEIFREGNPLGGGSGVPKGNPPSGFGN